MSHQLPLFDAREKAGIERVWLPLGPGRRQEVISVLVEDGRTLLFVCPDMGQFCPYSSST
jgi:hypothetical protein